MRWLWRANDAAAEVEELWRAYLRSQRQSRRALRWTLLLAIGRKVIFWDLLREPSLERELPADSSSVSFFVPSGDGGMPLDIPGGRTWGIPLQTRLIPAYDEGLPADGVRLSVVLKGGPLVALSIREAAGTWRLNARFRERTGWRAAQLGFQRLAPEGGFFQRFGRLVVSSFELLVKLLRPFRAFGSSGHPAAARMPDFYLGALSPGLLSSQKFLPTLTMGALLCPLLSGLLAAFLVKGLGGSLAAFAFCLSVGVCVAWTGGLVCGSTVSVVASTIGAIPLSIALATLDGVLFEAAGRVSGLLTLLPTKPFRYVALGGLPLLARAPVWSVVLVDAGLVLLSFAMAAARRTSRVKRAKKARNLKLMKVVAMVIACAGPGLVAGLSFLLEKRMTGTWPLLVSLGLVGGAAFSACLAIQSAARRRTILAGGLYASMCFLLPLILNGLQGTLGALLLVVVGVHVLLQGTFFALAYLLGENLGGVWMGAIVSSLQGAGGYTAFLIAMGAVSWR